MRPSVPSQLHALMVAKARSFGISTSEAYRRALRWTAQRQAWGLVVDSGPTLRFDLVLTPAILAEVETRARFGDRASRVIAQAASAWILHHQPPQWLAPQELRHQAVARPPVARLRDLLYSGKTVSCAELADYMGVTWARAYGLLQAAARLGDLEVAVVEGEVVARATGPRAP